MVLRQAQDERKVVIADCHPHPNPLPSRGRGRVFTWMNRMNGMDRIFGVGGGQWYNRSRNG